MEKEETSWGLSKEVMDVFLLGSWSAFIDEFCGGKRAEKGYEI